jgi:hypothetical protein
MAVRALHHLLKGLAAKTAPALNLLPSLFVPATTQVYIHKRLVKIPTAYSCSLSSCASW